MSRLKRLQALERTLSRVAIPTREDAEIVGAVARAIAVLEAFDDNANCLSNTELANRSGLSKSTVSRLTATLARLGYLTLEPERHAYRLGAGVVKLVRNFLGARGLRSFARPRMEALAQRFKTPAALSERESLEMVYIEYCRADAAVVVLRQVGSRVPLGTSAAGRAYFVAAPRIEQEFLAKQLAWEQGDRWPRVRDGLEHAQNEWRTTGFVTSLGEWLPEVNAVGVPIRSPIDGSLCALTVAAPAALVAAERFRLEIGPALVETAQLIRTDVTGRGRAN